MRFYLLTLLVALCFINPMKAELIGVIPTPQNIEYKSDTFVFSSKTLIVIDYKYNDTFAVDLLQETIEDAIGNRLKVAKKAKSNRISIEISDSEELKKIGEQGYILDIDNDGITISSISETGVFYGIQSLRQIIRDESKGETILLKGMKITDFPSLEHRGWLDDISRGPIPTMDFIKKQIATLAEYKLNFFNLYTEHVFKVDKHASVAPTDGLTQEQIQEIVEFAAKYHIEVIGNQQCLAHAEKTLRIPYYINIKDTEYNVNPGTEDTYRFYEDVFAEVAPAYSSQLFNINCDETDALGSGFAKYYVDSIGGSSTTYAKHINRIYDILQKYDKKVMMWGDIATTHPEIIPQLPQDIIIVAWSYVNSDSFIDMIQPFKSTNLEFMIAPGVGCWGQVFPDMHSSTRNIAKFCRDGKNSGAMGMMNTCWDDSGENFFNNNWYGLIWGAEVSWKTISNEHELAETEILVRQEEFNNSFNKLLFNIDSQTTNIAELYLQLDSLRFSPVPNILTDRTTWRSVTDFYPPELTKENYDNNLMLLQRIYNLKNKFVAAKNHISKNNEVIDYAIFACDRLACNVYNNICRIKLYNVYNTPVENISADNENVIEATAITDTLFQHLKELRHEYARLWNLENRGFSREIVMSKFDEIGKELADIDKKVFVTTNTDSNNQQVASMRTLFGSNNIYYTTDGTEPSIYSMHYEQPIAVQYPTLINAKYIDDYIKGPISSKFIFKHKGVGKLMKLNSQYSTYNPAYSAGGDNGTIDGIKGSDNYADGCWQGYQGQDYDIELNFMKTTDVNSISVRFYNNVYNWIMSPSTVEVYVSKDGKNYEKATEKTIDIDYKNGKDNIITFSINNLGIKTQYLKVVAKNAGHLPEYHQAPGAKSYIFVDELVIE